MAHITSKGRGRWLIRIFLGRDGAGKQQFQNKVVSGSKADALAWAQDAQRDRDLAHVTGTVLTTVTVGQLLQDVLGQYEIGGSAVWAEQHIRLHLDPFFGATVASRLSTDAIRKFTQQRLTDGAQPATVNRSLVVLKRALRLAMESIPPKLLRMPHVAMLRADNVRKGFFEPEHLAALLPELPEYLRPILIAGYWTGARRGELIALRWNQVDLQRAVIRLAACETKTKRPRTIPLAPALVAALTVQRAKRDALFPACGYVFFGDDGQPLRSFNKAWNAACVRAGLPGKLFHDCRRTAARNMIRSGVSQHVAMKITGHRTASIFARYDIVDETDLLAAVQKLQRHVDEQRAATEDAATSCTLVAPAVQ